MLSHGLPVRWGDSYCFICVASLCVCGVYFTQVIIKYNYSCKLNYNCYDASSLTGVLHGYQQINQLLHGKARDDPG